MNQIAENEIKIEDCLKYDPFAYNDEGSCETISNKLVHARKEHVCENCQAKIKKGEYHRVQTDKFEGQIGIFRWCYECCKAMVLDNTTGGELFIKRFRNPNLTTRQNKG